MASSICLNVLGRLLLSILPPPSLVNVAASLPPCLTKFSERAPQDPVVGQPLDNSDPLPGNPARRFTPVLAGVAFWDDFDRQRPFPPRTRHRMRP